MHVRETYTALLSYLNKKEFEGNLITKLNSNGILPQKPQLKKEQKLLSEDSARDASGGLKTDDQDQEDY